MASPTLPSRPSLEDTISPIPLVVEAGAAAQTPEADAAGPRREVLAWGIETATGLVRHIRDLKRVQTGRACGIQCVGCGLALEAFNAGAETWLHRPHFKHPPGTQRDDCHIVAARMAMVNALAYGDTLSLPARSRSGTWVGLSGTRYEIWRNLESEQARIRSIDYTDRTRALITLYDGRQLAVMLRGEFSLRSDDTNDLACLTIEAGANAELLSQLSPEELRQRLMLLPDASQWRCHWLDGKLSDTAALAAKEQAREALDEWPSRWADEATDRRRETLLHRLVREILSEAKFINVPGWRYDSEPGDQRSWPPVQAHRLVLSNLLAERGLAGRIPDIQCAASAEHEDLNLSLLAIEVVVHNNVTETKLNALSAAGAAVLAVTFKNWGGELTIKELKSIVVSGLESKQWLYHPLREKCLAEIAHARALSKAWSDWNANGPVRGERSAQRPIAPADDYAAQEDLLRYGSMYRETAIAYLNVSMFRGGPPTLEHLGELTPKREDIWIELTWLTSELEDLGAPGGTDAELLLDLMPRLLSIQENRGVGHALSQNARAVINHVWTEIKVRDRHDNETPKPSPSAALTLIAFQRYELKKRDSSQSRPYEAVRGIVHRSLTALEDRFLWEKTYSPLLRAVFPELAGDIDSLSPRMEAIAEMQRTGDAKSQASSRIEQ